MRQGIYGHVCGTRRYGRKYVFHTWIAHLQELEWLYTVAIQVSSLGLLHFYTPTTMSSAKFQAILDASLVNYAKQTGIDLSKHPSADKLQNCQSPEGVIQVLLERETAFNDHRDKHRKLIDCLRPVVQIVHGCSGVIGEAVGLVSSKAQTLSSYHMFKCPPQVPFQPTKAIFVAVDVLLSVCITLLRSPSASSPNVISANFRQLLASAQAMMP